MSRTDGRRPTHAARPAQAERRERKLAGIPVSSGIAIGPVFGTIEPEARVVRHKIHATDIEAEGARLDAAIAQSRKQLLKLRARLAVLPDDARGEIAPLLDAYIQMLGTSRLVRESRRRIREMLVSSETA